MARIETYPIDTVLSDSDLLFGTNADDANATVNFTVGDLKTYILQGMANGTVTSVSGVGTVSGLTLTGTVTTSGDLTLGGTLALTSSDITTGLGYTPPTTNTTYDYGAVGAAGNISMAMTGSDATNDVVVMQAGTNITLTDNGSNIFTIDAAGGSGGVASFTNANGTFISATQTNTTATGTVTMGTIDLSATGTKDNTTFLRGDNTWATAGWALQANNSAITNIVNPADTVLITGINKINTAQVAASTGPRDIEITHNDTVRTDTASVASPGAGGTFTVVDSITQDATGHPTAVNVKTITLPAAGGGSGTVTSVAATHGGDAFVVAVNNDPSVDPSVDITMGGSNTQYINGAGDLIALSTLPGAGAGTVSSVDVSGGTTGLTTSGGPITTSGVITLAGTLAAASGGTGKTSYTVADLLYANTTSSLAKLGIGTTGQVLAVTAGGLPSWETISGTGTVTEVTGATSADGFIRASTINTTSTPVVTAALQYTGTPDFNNFFCGDGTFKPAVLGITTTGTSGAANFDPTSGILNIPEYTGTGTVTSVALTAPSAFTVTGSPITSSGTLAIAANGTGAQYIDGAGALQTFPNIPQGIVTSLTTNNTSGAATLSSGILNVPIYSTAAAGAAGDVQYNNGSNGFAAESTFNYNATSNILTIRSTQSQPSIRLSSANSGGGAAGVDFAELQAYHESAGSDYKAGAIKFVSDGGFGANDVPTRIELQTSPNASSTPVTRATVKSTGELILNQYGSGTFNSTAVKSLGVTASGNVVERDVSGGNINEMATQSLDVNSGSFIGMSSSNAKLVLTNSDGSGATKTVEIRGGTGTLGTTTNGIMTIRVQSSNSGLGQTQITYASPSGSVNIGPAAAAAAWILTFAYYGEVDMVLIDATAI